MAGGPSRRSKINRQTLLEVRKWLGYPPGGPEVVGGPSLWFESGMSTLLKSDNGQRTLS